MPTYYSFPENSVPSGDFSEPRPRIQNTKSFSRLDSSPARPTPLKTELEVPNEDGANESFAASPVSEDEAVTPLSGPLPEGFDDLPPETVTLTERFLESLNQRTYPAPLNVDQLSILFQEFYVVASENIRTHISNLYISLSSRKRNAQTGARPEQQMLSFSEISEKRKNRKLLEAKGLALQEAVERKVCEAVYDKLWRHKSTDDEARDESLRSKTAALTVVGVKLGHLGVPGIDDEEMITSLKSAREGLLAMSNKRFPLAKLDVLRNVHKSIVDVLSSRNSDSSADRILPTLIFCLIHAPPSISVISDLFFIQRFRASKAVEGEAAYCLTNLEAAISFIETVNLNSLKVEGADFDQHIKVSEQSAGLGDQKAGTDGSTEITLPVPNELPKQAIAGRGRKPVRELTLDNGRSRSETPYVPADDPLSNLNEKLLSARIDHSLKQAEEAWACEVARTPSPTMTRFGPDVMKVAHGAASSTMTTTTAEATATIATRSRGLSYLTNPAADLAGTVVNTADAGLKTIGSTLENSYKFLFGKMDEKQTEMPKTLEEARKLMETPLHAPTADGSAPPEDVLRRSGSRDSIASKTASLKSADKAATGKSPPSGMINPINLPSAALGVVGNSLRGIAGINVMRSFNRSSTNLSTVMTTEKDKDKTYPSSALLPRTSSLPPNESTSNPSLHSPPADLLRTFPDLASPLLRSQSSLTTATLASLVSEESIPPTPPPRPPGPLKLLPDIVDKFMDVADIGELKVSELQELLIEYKKLGGWIRGLDSES